MKTDPIPLETLRARLARVESELADTMRRMPAHSVKPNFMAALLELEDERDHLLAQIANARPDGTP